MDWSQPDVGRVCRKPAKQAVYLEWLDIRADSSYKQCVPDAELKICRRAAMTNLHHHLLYGRHAWEIREV